MTTPLRQYARAYAYPGLRALATLYMARSAGNLGIDHRMLGRWVKEFQVDEIEALRGNGKRTAEQEELHRLRAENKRLKLEREILKNDGLLRERVELRYQFIAQQQKA